MRYELGVRKEELGIKKIIPADYADSADLRGWGLWGLVAILILNTYFKTLKKFCGHQRDLRYLREKLPCLLSIIQVFPIEIVK